MKTKKERICALKTVHNSKLGLKMYKFSLTRIKLEKIINQKLKINQLNRVSIWVYSILVLMYKFSILRECLHEYEISINKNRLNNGVR